ncbi:MAG: hypothetical protein INR64_09035 [Caulobacteraceae bacterium]|nr:hypothetical protein [Caulobacter sp.]
MSSLTFPAPHLRHGFRAAAAAWWAEAVQAWHLRQADRAMQGLSDAMLQDIGVARGEISEVTRHGRFPHG